MQIFGGLLLEDIALGTLAFQRQVELHRLKLIDGVQIRVSHPSLNSLSQGKLAKVICSLPENMWRFVHIGGENVGNDFGQINDEKGIFGSKTKSDWQTWNEETLNWSLKVIESHPSFISYGVAHAGYGLNQKDRVARLRTIETIKKVKSEKIVLENVPPLVTEPINCWGFRGTPDDMSSLLQDLGSGYRCLIDFTHLIVTVNQAQNGDSRLKKWQNLDKAIDAFLNLPHCDVCHFSGIPPTFVIQDNHGYLLAPPIQSVKDALHSMSIICIESRFDENAAELIKKFRLLYELYEYRRLHAGGFKALT